VRLAACTVAALLACAAGCSTEDPAGGMSAQAPALDYNEFVCNVQPTLIRRCSYLACHGNADHALRIYSPGKLRLTNPTTRNDRDASLSQNEVQLNFTATLGILAATTADDRRTPPNIANVLLLSKPLVARLGGNEHRGVGIFPVYPARTLDKDTEWQALVAWIGGKQQPKPVDADCQNTFDNMMLSPQ
jgi:hypothetical protein